MSFLVELLMRVGLGAGAVTASVCLLIAFYLFRARSVGAQASAAGAAIVGYSVAILLVFALVLGLGWFDPHPGIMWEHIGRAANVAADRAADPVRRLLRWLVTRLAS